VTSPAPWALLLSWRCVLRGSGVAGCLDSACARRWALALNLSTLRPPFCEGRGQYRPLEAQRAWKPCGGSCAPGLS
jgi:hypothetical protein